MANNSRSKLITQGEARSPNRAMLRAVGFGDGDFDKPIVGVANGHSTMNPCNAGIQPLVDLAMSALREAGAMPHGGDDHAARARAVRLRCADRRSPRGRLGPDDARRNHRRRGGAQGDGRVDGVDRPPSA